MGDSAKYVAYYRVSTRLQGVSGLGLGDQKHQVESYVGKENVVAEFVEVESGRKKKRVELDKAMNKCKAEKLTLVVSCLDRLGRVASQLHFIKDNVKLLCVDRPNMNDLEFAIFAGMAEFEAKKISQRTKAALAEKKRKGFKLGSPQNLTKSAIKKSAKVRRKRALEHPRNKNAYAHIRALRKDGMSYRLIAEELNANDFKTTRGNKFSSKTAYQIEKMYKEAG